MQRLRWHCYGKLPYLVTVRVSVCKVLFVITFCIVIRVPLMRTESVREQLIKEGSFETLEALHNALYKPTKVGLNPIPEVLNNYLDVSSAW